MANHSTVKDTGAFFTIEPETREVKVPPTHKVIGVVGDHLAEQLTFEIPKLIDGHDIAGCVHRYVGWVNVEGERGSDQLVELTELPEGARDGMLYFTWTIRDKLAATKGLVQFSLHFEDVDANGERLYHWGTTVCKNCEILDAINHTIGAYAAIYVAEDTLIFSDYAPVEDGALALETPGIVPEGTLEINAAGVHDVGKYAQAKVLGVYEAPTISVDGSTGVVTAEAHGVRGTHKLTEQDCLEFKPENIVEGKNVFGLTGTATPPLVRVILNGTLGHSLALAPVYVHYTTYKNGAIQLAQVDLSEQKGLHAEIQCVKDTPITFLSSHLVFEFYCSGAAEEVGGVSGNAIGFANKLAAVGVATGNDAIFNLSW